MFCSLAKRRFDLGRLVTESHQCPFLVQCDLSLWNVSLDSANATRAGQFEQIVK